MLTRGQFTAILCCACIGAGLGFVRITQHQEQENDQSQNTVVNTITQTTVVNYTQGREKYKGVVWTNVSFSRPEDFQEYFYSDLNEWQRETAKILYVRSVPTAPNEYWVLHRVLSDIPLVFTNETRITNRNSSINTNTVEIGTIWSKVRGLFSK